VPANHGTGTERVRPMTLLTNGLLFLAVCLAPVGLVHAARYVARKLGADNRPRP
jgi:hypothetical protein